jgi:hypothetical protein
VSDPRWTTETLESVSQLGAGYSAAEEILTWLADNGLLLTPQMAEVLEAAKRFVYTGDGWNRLTDALDALLDAETEEASRD